MKVYNKDVVADIAQELGCSNETVKKVTDAFVKKITDVLSNDNVFYVKNLGRLMTRPRSGYTYKNKEGVDVSINDVECVYFKASSKLKKAVNK